jgi:asparagine synthase (glutamine-hydrolysing)
VGVPSEVLNRPKQGFALPLGAWMCGELKELVSTTLLDAQTLQRGYFQPNGVKRMLDEHLQGRRDHSARLWRLLIFELWHRNFLAKIGDANTGSMTTSTHATTVGVSGECE